MSTPEREEEEYSFIDVPKELRVWAIDSGVRHANAGGESDYSRVRCGTFMGKKVLVNELNARYYRTLVPGEVSLCGVLSAHAWDHGSAGVPIGWSQLVEEELSGASFLARFIRHDDEPNTSVDPERTYALRAPVHHALHEHARVQEFLHVLRSWPKTSPADDETVLSLGRRLGDLMFASHDSYTSVGLGADATDALVDLVREVDPDRRLLFGAKNQRRRLRRRRRPSRSRRAGRHRRHRRRSPTVRRQIFPRTCSYARGRRAPLRCVRVSVQSERATSLRDAPLSDASRHASRLRPDSGEVAPRGRRHRDAFGDDARDTAAAAHRVLRGLGARDTPGRPQVPHGQVRGDSTRVARGRLAQRENRPETIAQGDARGDTHDALSRIRATGVDEHAVER